MAEEKKEKWLNYLAGSTVIFAVCATLSTFKGGGFSTKSLLCQSKASDQWSFYQAKGIKSYMYELQKDELKVSSAMTTTANPRTNVSACDSLVNSYAKKIEKYEAEKKEIKAKAEAFEAERDEAKLHSQAFGMAVIFLQVSILLSSIAALIKKKPVWYLSLATGILGIFWFFNGFFLFL